MSADDGTPNCDDWVVARRTSLLRTAWLLTGERDLAEDLVQTALVRCWPKWSRIRRMNDIDGYVRKVITTTYLSWWRRKWRGEKPTGSVPDSPQTLDIPTDRFDLLRALSQLPRGQRAVVVLRFADDLSEARTAEILGCSIGTVKSQASRALKALRADPTLVAGRDPA